MIKNNRFYKSVFLDSVSHSRVNHELKKSFDLFCEKPLLFSVDGVSLSYADFWKQIEFISGSLKKVGLRNGDSIITYIPDNFYTPIVIFSVVNTAICVPLNRALTSSELCASIKRIKPRAIIINENINDEQFNQIKKELNFAVIKISWQAVYSKPKITTDLDDFKIIKQRYSSDISLILMTSATTGRSKLVPLRHKQLLELIKNGFTVFPEAMNGRILIMIPHFHIQWLMAYFIQMFSGGSIIQTEGFNEGVFIQCFTNLNPTQFTANPTILEALTTFPVDFYKNNAFSELRFIVSTGTTLLPALRNRVENLFHTRVYQGYGLTETSAITKTPKLVSEDREGSVGKCIGAEVKIIDEAGEFLDFGETGEIIVRGSTVISAYIDDPEANKASFINGWFRTGDLGKLDADGFLYLSGRKKEMINRGAEKILPGEVEEAILRHPSVKEAVVFPYPHIRLGEDVAACIVLNNPLSLVDLRKFLKNHIAPFKIPHLIFHVESIPKGTTGKPQRTKLAELLLPTIDFNKTVSGSNREFNDIEYNLAEIWKNLLNVNTVDLHDDFFQIGGDSICAVQMLCLIEEKWGCVIKSEELIISSALESIAGMIQNKLISGDISGSKIPENKIIVIQETGNKAPYFLVALKGENLSIYRDLIRELGTEQPIYGLTTEMHYTDNISLSLLEQIASIYVDLICKTQPEGQYHIAGTSLSGMIALETANQLILKPTKIVTVILFDTFPILFYPQYIRPDIYDRMLYHKSKIIRMSWDDRRNYLAGFLNRKYKLLVSRFSKKITKSVIKKKNNYSIIRDNFQDTAIFLDRIKTNRNSYSSILFWCHLDIDAFGRFKMLRVWKKYLNPDVYMITGTHHTLMQSIHLKKIIPILKSLKNQ
ncbi:MAG: AMP-binding protein [Bacteroidetes bacterium]|nr:AMP-binding protein [Bacteroidota bacterium]